MPKVCDMLGVREYSEGMPVEFWFDEDQGRMVIIARNQAGYDCTSIDLGDLISWLQHGPSATAPSISGESAAMLGGNGADSSRS
jgi:hypothetical protein